MPKENTIYELRNNLSILLKNAPAGMPADGLQSIMANLAAPLQVMIMGEFSVGKSTFINALLEKEVAIASPIPTTAVITKFVYGSKDRTIVHFLDGTQQEYNPQDFNRLTVENNGKYKEMHDRIEYVERQLPNDLLQIYNFIDSPGRNAIVEKHEEVTRNFVENADAMLWLFSVDQMGGKSEKEVLQSFSKRLKPIAIVNKVDMVEDDDELDDLLDELKLNFKDDIADIVPISAEYALQGVLEQKKDLLEVSNFKEIFAKLKQHIGARQAYLKTQKAMQDLVPVLKKYEVAATQAVRNAFRAKKENYAWYASKLKEMVNAHDSMGEVVKKIAALLAEAIGERELPESNEDYSAIRSVSNAWNKHCHDGIGAVLYAALHGDAAAQYEYAKQQRAANAAEYWYKESGAGGYLPAQQVLYKNYQPAGYWYERAAQNGDKYAILQIALSYYFGRNDVEKNLQKAAYWLERAVQYEQDGVNEAQYRLACLYADGSVVKQDYNKAYALASAAAKAGYVPAMGMAAELLYNGEGVQENKMEAFLLWLKGSFNKEIENYFVNGNLDLHKSIAEKLCITDISLNKKLEKHGSKLFWYDKYSSAYFWYELDFEDNDNVDSAYRCGEISQQRNNSVKALYWYDICAKRKNLEAIKQAGDICYFKLNKKWRSMKYYARGMLQGDRYCGSMLWKGMPRLTLKLGVKLFVTYAVISVIAQTLLVEVCEPSIWDLEKESKQFQDVKSSLDKVQMDYQKGGYIGYKLLNDDDISNFRKNIEALKEISRKQKTYRNVYNCFLFSDYVMKNYSMLRYSWATDKYDNDYDDTLHSMEQKLEWSLSDRIGVENTQNQGNGSDMQLSPSDIGDAVRAFTAYHAALTAHDFDQAYDMLTVQGQFRVLYSRLLSVWVNSTEFESKISDVKCKEIDGNGMILEYKLREKVVVDVFQWDRYYQGEVNMFKINGKWRVGYDTVKLISER